MSSANAKRYRELREARGWSHHDLARAVGTDPETVAKWESGEAEPNEETVGKLADAYGMSQDAFRHEMNVQHHPTRKH